VQKRFLPLLYWSGSEIRDLFVPLRFPVFGPTLLLCQSDPFPCGSTKSALFAGARGLGSFGGGWGGSGGRSPCSLPELTLDMIDFRLYPVALLLEVAQRIFKNTGVLV
jgi:hypothetical protein